jgi:tRNA nucleotidyltransferase (CCA-adding enzyme)
MHLQLPDYVNSALNRLEDAGYEACAVGGCVRDLLMHRTPGDYDITTAALPAQTAAVFASERVIETGVKHGTVTVLLSGHPIEITTYRVDGAYSDSRHPDAVRFTPSLREDLARRDFTMNAMAYSPGLGLVDPFGGAADIERRLIRCVGDPAARFREDALRIARCVRFSAVLGFAVAPATAAAAREHRALLRRVSAERIAEELKKLVCGPDVRRVVLAETDILGEIVPELLPMRGFDQRNKHHCFDILEHCAAACEAVPPEPVIRLAALLHDVGKPDCFFTDADGAGHFYGHAERGALLTDAILRRLRFDNESRETVTELVRRHDMRIEPERRAVLRALRRYGPEFFFRLMQLKRADALAHAPGPKTDERLARNDLLEALAREAIAEAACFSLKDLAVDGRDLIAAGYAPGPALGQALEALLDAVTDGRVPNEKTALLAYLPAAEDGEIR